MSNILFAIAFFGAMFTILAATLWGPTVFLLIRKRKRGEIVPLGQFSGVLVSELLIASIIVVVADLIGLRNPGGYVLATAIVVGAAGAYAFSRMYRVRDS
jgi:hypothetical protein